MRPLQWFLCVASLHFVDSARACEVPTTVEQFAEAVAGVYSGWDSLDAEQVRRSVDDATRTLDCLGEVVTSADIAEFYRTRALNSFLSADHVGAKVAFHSAYRLQPSYQLPSAIAGEGHPLHTLWSDAPSLPDPELIELALPADGWLQIDGSRAQRAPDARPYVFQHVGTDGGVKKSALVSAGAIPRYQTRAPAGTQQAGSTGDTMTILPDRSSRKMLVAGGIVGGVGVAALATAVGLKGWYRSAPADAGELNGAVTANYIAAGTGWTLVGVSAGLGTTAVVRGRW